MLTDMDTQRKLSLYFGHHYLRRANFLLPTQVLKISSKFVARDKCAQISVLRTKSGTIRLQNSIISQHQRAVIARRRYHHHASSLFCEMFVRALQVVVAKLEV